MVSTESNLIDKICNDQDFDEILLNIVKQRKDNGIKRILHNISENVSMDEKTKRQIYEEIFKYVNDINDNIKINVKEIYTCAVANTICWLKNNQQKKERGNIMKSKIKVIIADDNVTICELLERFLRKNHNDVEILGIANTDEEEIDMIEKLKPEIVITDLMRHGKYTGLDIIKKYYKDKTGPEFLVISADIKQTVINNGLEVAGYIRKPSEGYEIIYENLVRIKHELEHKKYLEWNETYHNEEIVDLKKHLSAEDFEIIVKLGSKIKDKVYTEYEFEVLNMELLAYYKTEDMNEEELKEVKSLEGTGVSRKQYNDLMEKIEKINEIYHF